VVEGADDGQDAWNILKRLRHAIEVLVPTSAYLQNCRARTRVVVCRAEAGGNRISYHADPVGIAAEIAHKF